MCCSFVVFSLVMNSNNTTANIGDAFSDTNKDYDLSFVKNNRNSIILKSLKNFNKEIWKSIRINLLYNSIGSESSFQSRINSKYKYAFIPIDDTTFTILFDLKNQEVYNWDILFSIDTTSFDDKDIPIIQSIELFDNDSVIPLSFTQYDWSTNVYH